MKASRRHDDSCAERFRRAALPLAVSGLFVSCIAMLARTSAPSFAVPAVPSEAAAAPSHPSVAVPAGPTAGSAQLLSSVVPLPRSDVPLTATDARLLVAQMRRRFVQGDGIEAPPGSVAWADVVLLEDAILRRAEDAYPLLAAVLQDPREPLLYRMRVAALLGRFPGEPAEAALLVRLRDRSEDPGLRQAAIRALEGRDVVPEVLEVAHSEDRFPLRQLLAEFLGASGDRRAAPWLVDVLRHDLDTSMRCHAAQALGKLPKDDAGVTAALRDTAISDGDWLVRRSAATALLSRDPLTAKTVFRQLAEEDPSPKLRVWSRRAVEPGRTR